MNVSIEKAFRLAMNARSLGHVSSFQSRDPVDAAFRDKFGGAILVRCLVPEISSESVYLIFTTSGLNEVGDEACGIITLDGILDWQVSNNEIAQIIAKSNIGIAAKATGIYPGMYI